MDSDTISLADPAGRPHAPAGSPSAPTGAPAHDGAPGTITPAWSAPTGPAPAKAPAGPAAPGATGPAPVFVDLSGRRRRMGRRVGIACGGLIAAFLLAMGIGVATGANVPGTPWKAAPGAQHKKSQAPVLQPKSIPHGQNGSGGRPPVAAPSGAVPPGAVPTGPNRRTTGGRGPAPSGSSGPSTAPKPSSSVQPTGSATPAPSATRTRPGHGQVTPPGQTKRPKTAG
ncbi:hypothetical protein AB0J52_16525 [Spirillospora sp. NPDC049652]